MAVRDGLTDLWDRASFDRDCGEQVAKVTADRPLSLVMIDIDHFKGVNDTHGHPAGDLILKAVSRILRSVLDGKGEAYRYGGEEMAALLPNHSPEEAVAVAERARRTVEAHREQGICVTASFGIGTFGSHAHDLPGLVRAADTALYDAKHRGRNLVRVYGEPEPVAPTQSREPERKLPAPGGLTAPQKRFLRGRYLKGEAIKCPTDLTPLDVHDITTMGSIGRDLLVTCPNCGWKEELLGRD